MRFNVFHHRFDQKLQTFQLKIGRGQTEKRGVIEDLLAAAETLSRARRLRHEPLAIVTNSIGPGRLAADAALRTGLALATPDEAQCEALAALVPRARAGILTHVPEGGVVRLAEAASMLGATRAVGGVLAVIAPSGPEDATGIEALAAAGRALDKPLLACVMGEATGAGFRRRLADRGMAVFATPEQAVAGFFHLLQDRRARAAAREMPSSRVVSIAPDGGLIDRVFAQARAEGRLDLSQDEALSVLAAYGMPTIESRVATSIEAAVTAADELGYPAVVKPRRMARPDPLGRGRVMMGLRDAETVREAARTQLRDETALLVQHQAGRGRELLIRAADDPMFGPSLSFGAGGTVAEALDDVAASLPPLNLTLAHALLRRTRTWRTLGAFRDRPAADLDAVAAALVRVSQLLIDRPEIADIEVNPLVAMETGVQALDAWIKLRPEGERGVVALPPYPAELAEAIELRGRAYTVRPIRPEDAEAHTAFFARLTPEDVRYRFFSAMRALSSEQLARMTQVDYEREVAFVAIREEDGWTVGVSRLIREPGEDEAEFAIVVEGDAKGTGIARRLMERLLEWARDKRVAVVVGQVLADNAPMIAFVRKFGFIVKRLPDEPDLMEARLVL